MLDLFGTIIGLVYIYQEYKASIWLWITGIIMPVVYMFVYLDAGLYADFGMQVYYALAAVYGLKRSLLIPSLLLFLAAWALVYWILIRFTNSTVPVLDSFGNALSFIGLWWLARKYVEQWLLWIVIDAELSALYVYKGLPFTAGLYALYVAIAVAGYFKWKKAVISCN